LLNKSISSGASGGEVFTNEGLSVWH